MNYVIRRNLFAYERYSLICVPHVIDCFILYQLYRLPLRLRR
nr:MAG TPA: hypothetical protein [Caudoviricetes sp.]